MTQVLAPRLEIFRGLSDLLAQSGQRLPQDVKCWWPRISFQAARIAKWEKSESRDPWPLSGI